MMKSLGSTLNRIKLGQSLDLKKICFSIESNFSGIYTEKVINKMIKKIEKKKNKKGKEYDEDKEDKEENLDEKELKKKDEEKKAKMQEKIRKIKEQMEMEGYENKNKGKSKYTSEMLFKKLMIKEITELNTKDKNAGKSIEKLTFQQKQGILKSNDIGKIIKGNIMLNTGRYLMLFYDNGLTLNILYNNIKR